MLYTGTVLEGDKLGRTIGFPTINLDPNILDNSLQTGVYAATVVVAGIPYQGALYFGPRLIKGEQKNVLEIFILDFSQAIYGQPVQFSLHSFIRPPLDFASFAELQAQLQKDKESVVQYFSDTTSAA